MRSPSCRILRAFPANQCRSQFRDRKGGHFVLFGSGASQAAQAEASDLPEVSCEDGNGAMAAALTSQELCDSDGEHRGLFVAQTLEGGVVGRGAVEMLPESAEFGGALTETGLDVPFV